MDSKKLKNMISSDGGGLRAFAVKVGIPHTTLFNSLRNDDTLGRMPISNFIKVAHALGMTADELAFELEKVE